jgi:hypothetical protein
MLQPQATFGAAQQGSNNQSYAAGLQAAPAPLVPHTSRIIERLGNVLEALHSAVATSRNIADNHLGPENEAAGKGISPVAPCGTLATISDKLDTLELTLTYLGDQLQRLQTI